MPAKIVIPEPELQAFFAGELHRIRKTCLMDALKAAVKKVPVSDIDKDLHNIAPADSIQILASKGLRGELVFPTPVLLRQDPFLLGYYRLLTGYSQKVFYTAESGLSPFKTLETKGEIPASVDDRIEELCEAFAKACHYLVNRIHPSLLTQKLLHELTLLSLGPQLRGGANNRIGKRAIEEVFELIAEIVKDHADSIEPQKIELRNAAGRPVSVEFASDPDIILREQMGDGNSRNILAIEIKGGTDVSNIHNRLGEAEKSHQKARKSGFIECWTVVNVSKLLEATAKTESPSTDQFYNLLNLMALILSCSEGLLPEFEKKVVQISNATGFVDDPGDGAVESLDHSVGDGMAAVGYDLFGHLLNPVGELHQRLDFRLSNPLDP